ncbi:MAG: PQQ-binding-like beta-propeller repeat protein, partial [Opitutaceae bacterium]|nr:PQQ-binding-like beta-propeller repeat protein [Opitutaceae bacterium]
NVHQLEVAWTWRSGGDRPAVSVISSNPLMIDGVLYCTTPSNQLAALDAATGVERWRFDPFPGADGGLNRGLSYWRDGDDQRILFGAGRFLHAVDARTGRLIPGFGEGGRVNLSPGQDDPDSRMMVLARSPGVIYRNLIIMPIKVGEGPDAAASGNICAYDVRTGRLVWRFRTVPRPGEYGYETWPPDAWKVTGGANPWAGLSLDEERGLVFCPTGSATFDFWGGNRAGDNLFANSLIALDAATGKRVWHYQFVRHDLWDRDLPAPPNLLTVRRDGREIPAVAQITKSGHVFVFHRETGEPLFPIIEQPAPASDLPGEYTAPTQPVPAKPAPFSRQRFSWEDITDISPAAHAAVLQKFIKLRPHVPFLPPSREGTIVFPGFAGGGEWGGAATDPAGILYVNGQELPWTVAMIEYDTLASLGLQTYLKNCVACHGAERQGNPAASIPSLVGITDRQPLGAVRTVVKNGRGAMPPFGHLPDAEIKALLDYLQAPNPAAAPREDPRPAVRSEAAPATNLPFVHTGMVQWLDPEGYPAVKPPWGTLNAIDLNTGEYLWKIPFGEHPELTARGIPVTGTENSGGPIVTAGGLLFIGATKDEMFRAYDVKTGRELWKTKLPAGGYATPATYLVNGRQYVVIACGGGRMGTKPGDSYVAFALPSAGDRK